MPRLPLRLSALMATLALGCSGDAGQGRAGAAVETTASAGTAALAEEASVTLTEWGIELSPDSLSAGVIRFRVTNSGTHEHQFEVDGADDEWVTEPIPPGESVLLTADLAPGTYEVYCPIEESGQGMHWEKGMRTVLVVR